MKNVLTVLCVAVLGCGLPPEVAESEQLGVTRQAVNVTQGNVNQGNVNQGNVNQGNVNQGPWLGAKVILTSSVRFVDGPGVPSVSGSVLMRGSAQVKPPPVGRWPSPVAFFTIREVIDDFGSVSPRYANARIVGSFVDQQNYAGLDARNMLDAPYRDRNKLGVEIAQNTDVQLYQIEVEVVQPAPLVSSWSPLCPNSTPGNAALLLSGYFNTRGEYTTGNSSFLGFACADGTAAKCARWGYKPWRSLTPVGTTTPVPLRPLFQACTRAAMADYCGVNIANTAPGTPIDISDAYGFIKPTPKSFAWAPDGLNTSAESAFDERAALCVAHDRISAIQSCPSEVVFENGSSCTGSYNGWGWSACGNKGALTITNQVYERGQFGTCLGSMVGTTHRTPLVFVQSGTGPQGINVCSHAPTEGGIPAALAKDCNCTTRQVCGSPAFAGCCAMDPVTGAPLPNAWTAACVAEAQRIVSMPGLDCGNGSVF